MNILNKIPRRTIDKLQKTIGIKYDCDKLFQQWIIKNSKLNSEKNVLTISDHFLNISLSINHLCIDDSCSLVIFEKCTFVLCRIGTTHSCISTLIFDSCILMTDDLSLTKGLSLKYIVFKNMVFHNYNTIDGFKINDLKPFNRTVIFENCEFIDFNVEKKLRSNIKLINCVTKHEHTK